MHEMPISSQSRRRGLIEFAGHVLPTRAVRGVTLHRWDGRRWREEPDRRGPALPMLAASALAGATLAQVYGAHPALVVLLLLAATVVSLRCVWQAVPAEQYRVVVDAQFVGELSVVTRDPASAREMLRAVRGQLP